MDAQARCQPASLTPFARALRAAGSKKLILRMKAPPVRLAQPTRPPTREIKLRRSCPRARALAQLLIHSYCKELSAKASLEMVRADSARTDWFRGIPPAKADPVVRDRAEDVAGRAAVDPEEGVQAASVDPEGVVEVLAELLAECLEAEAEAAAPAAVGAED